jgi:thimet oligopeptidase
LTALSLNDAVYRALKAMPVDGLDPVTKYLLERSLLEFHLSGVDRDDATRAKVQELQDRISGSSADFHKNIVDDLRKMTVPRSEQEGLPADFIAHHAVDARGSLTITNDDADVAPVLNFAASAELRERVFTAYHQRGFPANRAVLADLLDERHQLAELLGYRNFAELDLADQMIDSTTKLTAFIDEADLATRDAASHEYRRLLKFAKARHPFLRSISEADLPYWTAQYRRSVLPYDEAALAHYFPYDEVQGGLLKTVARLFHLDFRPITGLTLWDPSVSAFAVIEHGKKIGIIYLDMHPRDGKNAGCSSAPLVPGMRGRQLPEGMLLCNFPSGASADGGLMQYDQVVQLFHEFGHLMHHILGGQGVWSQQESFNSEGDFVEAPSLMLEEFLRDPKVLETFAHRADSDESIPAELIEKMNAAISFGRAMAWRRQLLYSNYSLQLHQLNPATLDVDALYRTDLARFILTDPVDGLHLYAGFTHIPDYGAKYYSYVLDEVIAIDFFAQFEHADLLDGATALRYRHAVLEPGSSKPAEQLVVDFLGRSENADAFKDWLKLEFEP